MPAMMWPYAGNYMWSNMGNMMSSMSSFLPFGLFSLGIFSIFFFLIVALFFIFWIWMLVDCVVKKKFDDKLIWVLVLIFLHFIGALLYYFLVYRKQKR
jgi:prolipoprotein diacylglyceryltransferase